MLEMQSRTLQQRPTRVWEIENSFYACLFLSKLKLAVVSGKNWAKPDQNVKKTVADLSQSVIGHL